MRTRDVLRNAAKLIEKHGWVQGCFGDKRLGYCAAGAINHVAPSGAAAGLAKDKLRQLAPDGLITLWNDAPGRTKDEVVAALRKAAR